MDPIKVGKNLDVMSMEAAEIIPFGAAVVYSAAGTVGAAVTDNDTDILGFADSDEVNKQAVSGFYAQYDQVPIIVGGGILQVWAIANGSAINVQAGDYLDVAGLGDGSTTSHGILEESGSTAGGTRLDSSVVKAVESKTMGSASYQIPDTTAVGETTLTFTSAELTALDLSDGDYILLEDLNGDLQVNRQKSATSTVVTLEKANTVVLTSGNSDLVTKMFQVQAVIL